VTDSLLRVILQGRKKGREEFNGQVRRQRVVEGITLIRDQGRQSKTGRIQESEEPHTPRFSYCVF